MFVILSVKMGSIRLLGALPSWVHCPSCNEMVRDIAARLRPFLEGERRGCSKCTEPLDCWHAVTKGIDNDFKFGPAMALAGCRTLMFEAIVPPLEVTRVDLTDLGLPEDAQVVELNFTSQGGVIPLHYHGNEVIRDPFGVRFGIYGQPVKEPGENGNGVTAMATWFTPGGDDSIVRHLVDAARQYRAKRYDAVVVPANIAAEASLAPILPRFFSRFGSRENVATMLEKNATYADQLNVLMNVASDQVGLPRLRDDIRGILNRLRGLRNKVAHEGSCKAQTRRDAAEHLSAGIFVAAYASLLTERLDAEGSTST